MEEASAQPYSQIGDRMIEALPELSGAFEDYHAEWGGDEPGPYNLACDILIPALKRWLEAPGADDVLQRAFAFIEELAGDADDAVRDFAQAGIVNEIADCSNWTDVAERFMGPRTKAMLRVAME
jgi:hypothetical protein